MLESSLLDQSRKCGFSTFVYTGVLVLAAAGLLDGKRATTHRATLEELRQFETIKVSHERYIQVGKIVTLTGIFAGIDMALHVVRLLFEEELRAVVARRLEYCAADEHWDGRNRALAADSRQATLNAACGGEVEYRHGNAFRFGVEAYQHGGRRRR